MRLEHNKISFHFGSSFFKKTLSFLSHPNVILPNVILIVLMITTLSCGNEKLTVVKPKLKFSPSTLDFGGVIIGNAFPKELQITNEGSVPVKLTSFLDNSGENKEYTAILPEEEIQPTKTYKIQVIYKPTNEGIDNTDMAFKTSKGKIDQMLKVKGKGLKPNVSINPSPVDFEDVTVFQTKTVTITLSNVLEFETPFEFSNLVHELKEEEPFQLVKFNDNAKEDENPYEPVPILKGVIPPKSEITVILSFTPQDLGERKATVDLKLCPTCLESISLTGNGIKPCISVEPTELDFGTIRQPNSETRQVTLSNCGTSDLTLIQIAPDQNTSIEFSARFDEQEWGKLPIQIHAKQKMIVDVVYTPTNALEDIGKLIISSNAFDSPEVVVSLKAVTIGPDLQLIPAALDFGVIPPKSSSAKVVQLVNMGNEALLLGEILYTLDDKNNSKDFSLIIPEGYAGKTLEPGGDLISVMINYSPFEVGIDSGFVQITSNDPDSPVYQLKLTGEASDNLTGCALSVSPAIVEFGLAEKAKQAIRSLHLSNKGTENCELTDFSIVGGASAFSFKDDTKKMKTIKPKEALALSLVFTPPELGNYTAEVQFTSNDAHRTNPITVPLRGTGGDGCLTVIPSNMQFGVVPPGCYSPPKDATIYNTCSGSVQLTSAEKESSSSLAFEEISHPSFPISVTNTGSKLTFQYIPQSVGTDVGAYHVNHSLGTAPLVIDMFGESKDNAVVSDEFQQISQPNVDILWMLDDSCSMSDIQTSVGNNISSFISQFESQSINYQIALVTSDYDKDKGTFQCSPPIITRQSTADPAQAFKDCTDVGIDGGNEGGLENAYLALSSPKIDGDNKGFIRTDAAFVLIFVSDEEDQSPQPLNFYVDFFKNIKGYNNDLLFDAHAIIWHSGQLQSAACGGYGKTYGSRYHEVAKASGGITESICTPDWGLTLSSIALQSVGYRSQFYLSSYPDTGTILVEVDGNIINPANYTYDSNSNSIIFTPASVPPINSSITITYDVGCP